LKFVTLSQALDARFTCDIRTPVNWYGNMTAVVFPYCIWSLFV